MKKVITIPMAFVASVFPVLLTSAKWGSDPYLKEVLPYGREKISLNEKSSTWLKDLVWDINQISNDLLAGIPGVESMTSGEAIP